MKQIAALTHMTASTIYKHRKAGELVLPERDWATAAEVELYSGWVRTQHIAGLLDMSPGGLYRKSQMLALRSERFSGTCKHFECDKRFVVTHHSRVFCDVHMRIGVNEDTLLRLLKEGPNWISWLRARINCPMAILREVLVTLEARGAVRLERRPGRGRIRTMVTLVDESAYHKVG
jgi:hypothetical protein